MLPYLISLRPVLNHREQWSISAISMSRYGILTQSYTSSSTMSPAPVGPGVVSQLGTCKTGEPDLYVRPIREAQPIHRFLQWVVIRFMHPE